MDSSQCGKSIQLDLLSFAYTLANRAPEPLSTLVSRGSSISCGVWACLS